MFSYQQWIRNAEWKRLIGARSSGTCVVRGTWGGNTRLKIGNLMMGACLSLNFFIVNSFLWEDEFACNAHFFGT